LQQLEASEPVPLASRDPALRVIVTYKLVRGGLSLAAAVVLAVLVARGGVPALQTWAHALREHWTTGAAGELAEKLMHILDVRHAWLAVIGLVLDGGITLLEGWSLQRGYRWGYWLVVAVAAAFVPFELLHWVHKPTIGRALLFLANIAVAAYLARRVMRESSHA
jgi:uncharacterized membrane protein (DUF2068 family)